MNEFIVEGVKALIFDWDNTIVDTQNSIKEVLRKTIKDVGHGSLENIRGTLHISRVAFFKQLFGSKWEIANDRFSYHLNKGPIDEIILYDDVKAMLSLAKSSGIPMAIVSNKIGEALRNEVLHFGLDDYFEIVVGSGDTDEDKPSPVPVYHALNHMRIFNDYKSVIFIGDSITDLQCAGNVGTRFIHYRSFTQENLEEQFAHHPYFNCYTDLISLLNLSKLN